MKAYSHLIVNVTQLSLSLFFGSIAAGAAGATAGTRAPALWAMSMLFGVKTKCMRLMMMIPSPKSRRLSFLGFILPRDSFTGEKMMMFFN